MCMNQLDQTPDQPCQRWSDQPADPRMRTRLPPGTVRLSHHVRLSGVATLDSLKGAKPALLWGADYVRSLAVEYQFMLSRRRHKLYYTRPSSSGLAAVVLARRGLSS